MDIRSSNRPHTQYLLCPLDIQDEMTVAITIDSCYGFRSIFSPVEIDESKSLSTDQSFVLVRQ